MANKDIFSTKNSIVSFNETTNAAGGAAYKLSSKAALAQYACAGTFNGTFYGSPQEHLNTIRSLLHEVDPETIAKCALYGRVRGYMKDVPAFLISYLAALQPHTNKKYIEAIANAKTDEERNAAKEQLRKAQILHRKVKGLNKTVFEAVIDNGKMLRNFVQMMRSGQLGRKSLGTSPKNLVKKWIASRTPSQIFRASVGQNPSMANVIRMTHPNPNDGGYAEERNALYAYLLGMSYDENHLPEIVKQYEAFKVWMKNKEGGSSEIPNIPFQFLTSQNLSTEQWGQVMRNCSWQTLRENINTFNRHGVFKNKENVSIAAERLSDAKEIVNAKVFPYQLMAAWLNTDDIPEEIRAALRKSMEIAASNVPCLPDQMMYICTDVSGSMEHPITGGTYDYKTRRYTPPSKITCVDVAALISASLLRENKHGEIIPFAGEVKPVKINPRSEIMTIAEEIRRIRGGATACSAPLAMLNAKQAKGDVVVFISDYESWSDKTRPGLVPMMREWNRFKVNNPTAKLICIDLVPRNNHQVQEHTDILQIGGFSDDVYRVINSFLEKGNHANHWLETIEAIQFED